MFLPNYVPSSYKHRKSQRKTNNNFFSPEADAIFQNQNNFHPVQKIMAFSSRLGTVVLQRFTKLSLINSYSFRQNSIKLQAVRLCSSTKNSKPITNEQKVHEALNKMNQANQYGTIGGVFHISLSTLCLGFFYVLFSK